MTFDACLDKNKASSTAALPPPTTITSTNVSKAIVNHPYGLMVGIPSRFGEFWDLTNLFPMKNKVGLQIDS